MPPTTYRPTEPQIGVPALNASSLTQQFPLGAEIDIGDHQLAIPQAGKAIYIKSSAAILEGSLVDYDAQLGTGILAPATAGTGPCGWALSAIASGSFGWIQVQGVAKALAPNAVVAGAEVWALAATPGSVDDAVVAGEQILGAKFSTTTPVPAAGFAWVNCNRPFHQGGIT